MAEAAAAAAGATPLLPDEIVMWEILVRLPPNSLLRCRVWRRATSSHDYNFVDGVSESDITTLDNREGVDTADQLQTISRLGDVCGFNIEDSCDGLLLLSRPGMHFSIINPATRQYAPLRQIHESEILGMYSLPYSPTREYRLLLYRRYGPRAEDGCYVFRLGSGQPPRRIEGPEEEEEEVMCNRIFVLFCGRLHWYINHKIIVFDTIAESFRRMRSPIVQGYAHLFEMGDILGISSLKNKVKNIEIWVMEDYEGEVWKLKHVVELPDEKIRMQFGNFDYYWKVVVTYWNSDLLVLVKIGDWVLQVDMDGQLVASFHRRGLAPTRFQLKQTLVSHAFFTTLEGYVVNEMPFISPKDNEVNTHSQSSEAC